MPPCGNRAVPLGACPKAWLEFRAKQAGCTVLPIPGTTKFAHFQENLAALGVS